MNKSFSISTLIALALVASAALADSPELTDKNSGQGQAFVYTGGVGQASIRIDGDAARVLFEALEAPIQDVFSLVQTQTKKTDKAECVRSILGDIPGHMSGPNYHCTILVDKK